MDEEQQRLEKTPMIDPFCEDGAIAPCEEDLTVNFRGGWGKSEIRTTFARSLPIIGHLFVLCVYTAILFSLSDRPQKLRLETELKGMESHIQYEERIFDVLSVARPQKGRVPSPFEGRPTPENNQMWKNLTDLMLYGATREEAAELPIQTIQAYDDITVYPVIISVYHHLHCLDRLRRQAWGDINPNGESEKYRLLHTDHCVENLRQALLCHGDTTPVPLFYTTYDDNGIPQNYDAFWDVPHTCRNAAKLQEWAEEGHEVFQSGRLPNFIPVAGAE